jgi:uncharacterized protein with HEPN domain
MTPLRCHPLWGINASGVNSSPENRIRRSKPEQRFRDIVKNIDRIRAFTDGMTYEQFVADEKTRLAVERCLLIISEAAAKLGELAEEACPTVPWPQIRRSGNVLRHDYDEIDHAIV